MNKSKNDLEWEKIFDKYKILDDILKVGYSEISASKINEFHQARLMTKFDHQSQLPKLFADNNLSILPTSRGGYIIGNFETFCKFNSDDIEISQIEFPTFLESLDYRDITSEATAINCAFVSRILHDFTNEEDLFPTVSGRMGSSSFKFNINTAKGPFNINVNNSQIEIDGGYEGDNSLTIIEAKNYISNDFLIRQLYYPFKLWSGKINKKVRPVFLTYTNGIFHLREYAFTDVNHYNSIALIKHKKYAIQEGAFSMEVLVRAMNETKIVQEPKIPFPQADNFERVINLCELIKQNQIMSKEQYLQDFDFGAIDPRQHDYYTNAAKYLGLVEKVIDTPTRQTCFILSELGRRVFSLNIIERQKEFAKLIVSHAVFRDVLRISLENGELPAKEVIVEAMKRSKLHNVNSESTYFRRASTIVGWINWILNQIEE